MTGATDGARRFRLERDVDVSGVSGAGVVADGVVFSDGVTVVRWRGARRSTVVWDSLDDVEAIHGHGGATRVVWEPADDGQAERAKLARAADLEAELRRQLAACQRALDRRGGELPKPPREGWR